MGRKKAGRNFGENRADRVISKVLRGKVKKSKSGSAWDEVSKGLQKQKHQDGISGKRELGSKLKLLKKKFGNVLSQESESVIKQNEGIRVKKNIPRKFEKDFKTKSKSKKKKQQVETEEVGEKVEVPPLTRFSDDPIPKKDKWINRQRVLIFACRGIGTRDRHLMKDIRRLLPHSRSENKMERRENLVVVNEICTMKHCNKCVLFEGRANRDVYMWLSAIPNGPSAKFLLQNIYTMDELKFTGNCLVGSRPLLSFDENFEDILHYRLIKELLTQIFGIPNHHPKSQPFFDHVYTFSVLDNRIWFRNYQILAEDGALVEIGPRFIMNPVKIFNGSFSGETLWENPHYVTPAKLRQLVRKAASGKYVHRQNKKENQEENQAQLSYKLPETDEVFMGNTWETAKKLASKSTDIEEGSLKGKKKKKKKKIRHRRKAKQTPASSWSVQDNEN